MERLVSTRVRVRRNGCILVPAKVVREAGLKAGDELCAAAVHGRVMVTTASTRTEFFEEFVRETYEQLRSLGSEDRWSEDMTVREYLSLTEAERERLWEEAFQEAHNSPCPHSDWHYADG